ncbi:MAG: HAMP domain-containing histidine kinase [Candidatus Magnetoovum sp. WYHC-5]|nr:HAMP domain-containing histidine kinase [Candidatus Magnetoovum sp. WYHC-5]
MRSKLFFAFILVILTALISNVVYKELIIDDFNDFISGDKEDRIYWIMASVEGSYDVNNQSWDMVHLKEVLHWGIMLGFESYVEDSSGMKIVASTEVLPSLKSTMYKRMSSMFELPNGVGGFAWYPLYVYGNEIGTLYARPLKRLGLMPAKEEEFRSRVERFLKTSFLIAGGGALVLAVLFAAYLSYPLRLLTKQAERLSQGDLTFAAQIKETKKRLSKKTDEIVRLTGAFNYMIEALTRQDTLRRHLTSNITHELRTPLTIIKGNIEGIEDGIIEDPNTALRNIKTEVHRIIELLEGIEDITRAEASFFQKGKAVDIDLKEFIESIVETMNNLCIKKRLSIKTIGRAMMVKTYPEKLHIVLKNLLSNAIKYTKEGEIIITWAEYSTEGFLISVKDTGRGIAEAELLKIFERFYKGEASSGKGLGLSIVKELVEVMDGEVEVQSVVNKGSVFTVRFS